VAVTGAMGDKPSHWKTFSERTIYDNPWVWLGQVDVRAAGRGAVLASRGAVARGGDDGPGGRRGPGAARWCSWPCSAACGGVTWPGSGDAISTWTRAQCG
jgi:hypothetical protein